MKSTKIPSINPPTIRMNKENLCVHFNISYNTLRKRTEPIKKAIDFDKKRVFEGKELLVLYTFLYYYRFIPRLKTLFSKPELSKKDLNKILD